MDGPQRLRSPHVKLEEFLDCYLESDYKKELEYFSEPHLTGSIKEEAPDEALRYLALVLLHGIEERVREIRFARKAHNAASCGLIGEQYSEAPALKGEIVSALFDEINEMTGMDRTRRRGKLIVGLKNDEIDLEIEYTTSEAGEEKMLIHLPPLA